MSLSDERHNNHNNFVWEYWEKTVRLMQIMVIILAILVIAIGFGTDYQLKKMKVKTEGCMEILVFESEYISFLIAQNDLNLNETMDDFIRYKVEEELSK